MDRVQATTKVVKVKKPNATDAARPTLTSDGS